MRKLDQAAKEICQFNDQGVEANRRITELESLCKHHEEAIVKLKQENTSLELGIQPCNELVLEMAVEMELDRMGEDNNDNDDEGDVAEEEEELEMLILK
jgi:hypothetical protein